MDQNNFINIVHRTATKLLEYGYQTQQEQAYYGAEFWKIPMKGIYCLIGFDLFRTSIILNEFRVLLIRRRLEDFADNDSRYKPLNINLRNLMLGLYNMDIFPTEHYSWEFTDEQSLLKQVANAEHFILEYGIKWLEDPMSNLDWVGRRRIDPSSPNPNAS